MKRNKIYSPKEGYDIIAPYYDNWIWQKFWHTNEYPFIEKWCNTLSPGNGLDIGAGSGNNLLCFLSKGHKVDALDVSEKMLDICKKKYAKYIQQNNLNCIELDICNLPIYERKYDWVLSNRVFSHIKNIDSVIKKISNIIKFGGQCFISDIHPMHQYQCTNMTINNCEICIETFKHQKEELEFAFAKNSFDIITQRVITTENIINKEFTTQIPKLSIKNNPIFFYYIIRYK